MEDSFINFSWNDGITSNVTKLRDAVRKSAFFDFKESGNNDKQNLRKSFLDDCGYIDMSQSVENRSGNDKKADVSEFNDDISDDEDSEDDYEEIFVDIEELLLSKKSKCYAYYRTADGALAQYKCNQLLSMNTERKKNFNYFEDSRQKISKVNKDFGCSEDSRQKINNTKLCSYNSIIRLIKVFEKTSYELKKFNEIELSKRMKINKLESRIVYYTLRGWLPKHGLNPSKWIEKFPEDLSVNETFLWLLRNGQSTLAEYLHNYQVDGFLLKEIVRDDLLLQEYNDFRISFNELVLIQERFYPKRSRCYALDSKYLRGWVSL